MHTVQSVNTFMFVCTNKVYSDLDCHCTFHITDVPELVLAVHQWLGKQ